MSRYIIISTYPENGSKNIGDQLITNKVIEAIKNIKGVDNEIMVLYRGDQWENVENYFNDVDAIIFACFAIRNNMLKTYPYLEQLLTLDKPMGILASGTSIDMNSTEICMQNQVTEFSKEVITRLEKQSLFFGTRGVLTQLFCEQLGLKKPALTGDIAFWTDKHVRFNNTQRIKKIGISTPHQARSYEKSIKILIQSIKRCFPQACIVLLQHGVIDQALFDKIAYDERITNIKIYKDKDSGLLSYSELDLHIGYRVHGHVTALSHGIPSYLLEQDGRGADYGLTLDVKCSIPHYLPKLTSIARVVSKATRAKTIPYANLHEVMRMMAMVKADCNNYFQKFKCLEQQITSFSEKNRKLIELLP